MANAREEHGDHLFEESERISSLLKKQKPISDHDFKKELTQDEIKHLEIMDEQFFDLQDLAFETYKDDKLADKVEAKEFRNLSDMKR